MKPRPSPGGTRNLRARRPPLGAAYLPWRGRCGIGAGSVEGPSREALMRWLRLGAVVLSGMATTGCPTEFGKDGRIAKAADKDAKENVMELKGCSPQRRQEVCGPGQERSRACLECGEP